MKQELKAKFGEMVIIGWFLIFIMQDKLKKNIFLILAWLSFTLGTILFISSIATKKDHFPIGNLYLYIVFLLMIGILFACHARNQIRTGCYLTLEIEAEME